MTRQTGEWRCSTCGLVSTTFAAAQRHADTHPGARIETVIVEKDGR